MSVKWLAGILSNHESRWVFDVKVTHDFKSRVTGVDAPITLFKDTKSNTSSGIRFDWQSDTKQVVAGLFVAQAF